MKNEDRCYICKEQVEHKQATRAQFRYLDTVYEVEIEAGMGQFGSDLVILG